MVIIQFVFTSELNDKDHDKEPKVTEVNINTYCKLCFNFIGQLMFSTWYVRYLKKISMVKLLLTP